MVGYMRCVVCVVVGLMLGGSAVGKTVVPLANLLAEKFSAELDCSPASKHPHRSWCPVTLLTKSDFKEASGASSYLGLSMELKATDKVVPAIMKTTHIAVLHIDPDFVRVTSLKPSNEKEKQQLLPILMSLAATLKGMSKSGTLQVPKGLYGFLQSERKKRGHKLSGKQSFRSFRAKLPSTIYQVKDPRAGDVYVVVESASDGFFINIFPQLKVISK